MNTDKLKEIGVLVLKVFVGASVGALLTWILINWMPSLTILAGAGAAGYVVYIKVKK